MSSPMITPRQRQAATLIAVGGRTHSGKTTLVNLLISRWPAIYHRALSFTSRPRRISEGDDEYIFTDSATIHRLYHDGELLNLDFVYGNYYGISKESVSTALAAGVSAIKEVHPRNHLKLRTVYPKTLTVIIGGRIAEQDAPIADSGRRARSNEDDTFFNQLDTDTFDVTFTPTPRLSPEENAIALHAKINAILAWDDEYPRPPEIDRFNAIGYNAVAAEFDDDKRITTANFHTLSEDFFRNELSLIPPGSICLELGPGTGWLRESFRWPPVVYYAADISSHMIERLPNANSDHVFEASARNLPLEGESIDFVICSLCDGYLYPAVLSEIYRVLRVGGTIIISSPAFAWAHALRPTARLHKTQFALKDGTTADVYSFVYRLSDVTAMLQETGFSTSVSTIATGSRLLGASHLSKAITSAAANANCSLETLEILNLLRATREAHL